MIQYICDICQKRISFKDQPYQIEIAPIDKDAKNDTMHICESCHTIIMHHIGDMKTKAEEARRKEQEEHNKEFLEDSKIPRDYEYSNSFQNMLLRDFLQSPFYLNSHEKFLFRSLDNKIVTDYTHWMSHKIVMVNTPTERHPEVIVTLQ